MYIVIKRVKKKFYETLRITGASRSWDLSNLLNAPCPWIIPVGRRLWQRLTCTLTWAVVTPDKGHCWKGTGGVMELQDPEVPQCPSTTDPWTVPLGTAELPLGLPWDLCFIPPPSLCELPKAFGSWALVQSSAWKLPEEMGFIGKLWLHGKERGLGYSVGLVLSQCILHRHLTSAARSHKQCAAASLSHARVCAPGTLQAFCQPEVISAKYQGWILDWNAEFWLCTLILQSFCC